MEPAEAQQAAVAFRCWWLHHSNWFPLVFVAFILDSLLLVLMGCSFPSLFTDALFHLSSCSAFLHYFLLIGPSHSQAFLSSVILISPSSQNPTLHWKHFLSDRIPRWHVTLTVTVVGWVCCAHISNPFFCLACHHRKLLWTGITWIMHLQSTWSLRQPWERFSWGSPGREPTSLHLKASFGMLFELGFWQQNWGSSSALSNWDWWFGNLSAYISDWTRQCPRSAIPPWYYPITWIMSPITWHMSKTNKTNNHDKWVHFNILVFIYSPSAVPQKYEHLH